MAGTPFQEALLAVAREYGLRVEAPLRVSVGARELEVPVLLEDFGAERGMLLGEDSGPIGAVADGLVALGFGYSCIAHPPPDQYDVACLADMLADWGWSGEGSPPTRVADLLATTAIVQRS